MAKSILFSFIGLFLFSTSVSAVEKIQCKLKAGTGPFTVFDYVIGEKPELRVYWTEDSGRYLEENEEEIITDLESQGTRGFESVYHFSVDDWGSGMVVFDYDDEGKVAFTSFTSDSSSVSGYYRCETIEKDSIVYYQEQIQAVARRCTANDTAKVTFRRGYGDVSSETLHKWAEKDLKKALLRGEEGPLHYRSYFHDLDEFVSDDSAACMAAVKRIERKFKIAGMYATNPGDEGGYIFFFRGKVGSQIYLLKLESYHSN